MWIKRDVKDISDKGHLPMPVFYKSFCLTEEVKQCFINITALGIFELKINDNVIGDYFMPGWTNYNKYVNLCRYDITEYINNTNEIKVTVADGWYSGRVGYGGQRNVYGTEKELFAEIEITYISGRTEKIVTDESWRVADSVVTRADFFDGEQMDFRISESVTDKNSFAKASHREIEMQSYGYEPVRCVGTLPAKIILNNGNRIIVDLGQNIAGVISFNVLGEKDTHITVRYAEVLDENGNLYLENLRSAKNTDEMILAEGKFAFKPRFTYHGFRYAKITVDGVATVSDIEGIVLSEDLKKTGDFECSDEIINRIFKNVYYGQLSNFISIPTDCPQRDERLGWAGDAQVFCNSAMYNADCDRFFENYLKLLRTDSLDDGRITSFVPFFVPITNSTAGVPGWADAIAIIPYIHYSHYKDIRIIKENIEAAEKWVLYYLNRSIDGWVNINNPFGDWLSVKNEKSDIEIINQCLFGYSALLVSEMFAVLKNTEKHDSFYEVYKTARTAFRKKFFVEGKACLNSQTTCVLAYSVGYIDKEEVKGPLLKALKNSDYRLTTGFIGVRFLLPTLCEIGETDLAYKMIKTSEYPSWGYMIKNGATTIWERWNGYTKDKGFETPEMNSFNHYCLGSCVEWLYKYVLGINLDFNSDVIKLKPYLSDEISFAKGYYDSKNGRISVSWKNQDDKTTEVLIKCENNVKFECDFENKKVLRKEIFSDGIKYVVS